MALLAGLEQKKREISETIIKKVVNDAQLEAPWAA
jgi:hypothetical protein